MRERKKKLVIPKCDNCGERLYRSHNPFSNYFWGKIPSHCPRCGKQVSSDKKDQLVVYEGFWWLIRCTLFITILIVVIIIAF
ncbi:MAG: hypothetical protein ACXAEX_09480 [Promethearchaeota archaeon]|jgi:endogenous inhibitor of DNA gyrase (YacG/DUF329 family)